MRSEGLYHLFFLSLSGRRVQSERDGEMTHLVHETSNPLADFRERPYGGSKSQVSVDELLCNLR